MTGDGIGTDWFAELTGFAESGYEETQSRLVVRGERLHVPSTGRSFAIGRLELPSLAELRESVKPAATQLAGTPTVRNIVADVRNLHGAAENASAAFMVASQFNLLEMTGPDVTPEMGVTRYAWDRTQGPACARAAGAATLYRNYFVPVGGGIGQSSTRQIDCIRELGALLGGGHGPPWSMRNGYALCDEAGARRIGKRLAGATEAEIDCLRSSLRIGLHRDVEVTRGSQVGHWVTQAFCSAMPVAYSRASAAALEPIARLVLEAAYEATLLAAAINAASTGNRAVFLTLLGGGAFGNDESWIVDAMRRALDVVGRIALDVRIVSFGRSIATGGLG